MTIVFNCLILDTFAQEFINDEIISAETWDKYGKFLDYLLENMESTIKLCTKYKTLRGKYAYRLYRQALKHTNKDKKNDSDKLKILQDYYDVEEIRIHANFCDLKKTLKTQAAKEIFDGNF